MEIMAREVEENKQQIAALKNCLESSYAENASLQVCSRTRTCMLLYLPCTLLDATHMHVCTASGGAASKED